MVAIYYQVSLGTVFEIIRFVAYPRIRAFCFFTFVPDREHIDSLEPFKACLGMWYDN